MKALGTTLSLVVCAGIAFGLTACLGAHESDEPLEPLGSGSSAIISGELAEASPWAVQVYDVRGNTGDFYQCSGTLVAPRWVLTAQHCMADEGETTAVRVGSNTYGAGQRIAVDAVEVPSASVDLALLHLVEDADGPFVQIADAAPTAPAIATIYGWGSEGTPLVMAPSLKKASINIEGRYSDEEFQARGVTGTPWSGDSGGPWFVNGQQVGLTSGGIGQDGTNLNATIIGVDVTRHRAWIDATIASGPTVHPSDEVVLYDLSNFSGVSQSFGIGRYNVADTTIIGKARASSIRIPAGLRVTAFSAQDFGYLVRVYTSDTSLAGTDFDNDFRSFVVAHASDPQLDAVTFYENANFSGESFLYGIGGNLLISNPWTAWDMRISSVRVPPGFKVTLSDGWLGYPSQTRVLTADANLAPLNFDNMTRSYLIERQ